MNYLKKNVCIKIHIIKYLYLGNAEGKTSQRGYKWIVRVN